MESPVPAQTKNPSATAELTAVFRPISPTSVPTLIPEQEQLLAEALQAVDCILPCYLGIIPGETTLQDARAILESLGGRYWGPFQRTETDGAFVYTYQFHIGDPITEEKIVYAHVALVSDDNLVQIMEITSSTGWLELVSQKSLEIYQQYWRRYHTASEIMFQLGQPNQLYIVAGLDDELIIVYKNPNIRIDISGTANENNLCPRNRLANSLSVHMIVSSPESPFSMDGDGRVPLSDLEVYLPFEEIFGVTPSQFYEQVLSDPTICFEPLVKP
jgi:hypothetical protein